jgi:hypothetical protein
MQQIAKDWKKQRLIISDTGETVKKNQEFSEWSVEVVLFL